jgi:hypothetical protein
MKSELLATFLELSEDLSTMKRQKYEHLRAYYQKHFGKDTFRQNYYDELKFDFERIERLSDFFNVLSEEFPLLAIVLESVGTLKKERDNGQPIEWVQLWLPIVPEAKAGGNCYFINLLKMEDFSHE